jgi:hypothetical protein
LGAIRLIGIRRGQQFPSSQLSFAVNLFLYALYFA